MKTVRWDRSRVTSFRRGSKFQGSGKNTSSKIIGPRGRKVRIPRTADSFRSKTDNT